MSPAALPGPPRHYVRLEHDEVSVLADLTQHAEGVVVGARFDAPHWPHRGGEQLVLQGLPPRGFELRYEVERLGLRFFVDLESWRLPELLSHDDAGLGRTARTFIAQAVDLPLTIGSLSVRDALTGLCQAAVESQIGAALVFAPYFTIGSPDDPWISVNLQSLRTTLDLAGDLDVAAWIRLDRRALLASEVALLARRYASAMQERTSTVVLTVADMGDAMRSVDTLAAYLRLVRSFALAGLNVIVDGVGDFSPVPITAGAVGSISGTRTYRNSPLMGKNPGRTRRQPRLKYLVPERFQRISIAEARRRTASGAIPRCPRPGCRALLPAATHADLRHHNAHVLTDTAALAQRLGAKEFAYRLQRHRLVLPDGWAQAIGSLGATDSRSADA